MPDNSSFTTSSSESWISRLMGSFKSVLLGFIIFIGAFFLIWWNEGRAIKTSLGLEQGSAEVIELDINQINSDNFGKLVHLTGEISTDEQLQDNDFKFSVKALKLRRTVEMFQWIEKKEEQKKIKTGGGEETKTTYSYEKQWSNRLINSKNFKKSKKHKNPKKIPFEEYTIQSKEPYIGKYKLSESLLSGVNNFVPFELNNIDSLDDKNAKLIKENNGSQLVYIGTGSLKDPNIGDIIISFDLVPIDSEYSIIAQQKGERFIPFKTETGTTIEIISEGVHSAEELFSVAKDTNNMFTWVYRLAGLLMMYFGIKKVFKPLIVLTEVIPILGTILNMGISIFASVVAFVFSFITMAIAWVFYRPILGISLLAVALIVGIVFYIKASKKQKLKQVNQ